VDRHHRLSVRRRIRLGVRADTGRVQTRGRGGVRGRVASAASATHRAAIEEARRAYPDLSLEFVQGMYGVARPEIDARRNAALRQAGLQ
jgi:hypothetical protein